MYLRLILAICMLNCALAQRRPFPQRPISSQRPYVDPNLTTRPFADPNLISSTARPYVDPNLISSTQRPYVDPNARRGYSNPNDANAQILSQVSNINPDGSFYSKYETSNGISYEEQGQPKNIGGQDVAQQVQGSASWVSDDGQRISLSWVADENGVNFQGDHIPTPPPIPEAIQRALAWIAANPSNDEGQYRGDDGLGNYGGIRQNVYTTRRPDYTDANIPSVTPLLPQQTFAPRRPIYPGRRN